MNKFSIMSRISCKTTSQFIEDIFLSAVIAQAQSLQSHRKSFNLLLAESEDIQELGNFMHKEKQFCASILYY